MTEAPQDPQPPASEAREMPPPARVTPQPGSVAPEAPELPDEKKRNRLIAVAIAATVLLAIAAIAGATAGWFSGGGEMDMPGIESGIRRDLANQIDDPAVTLDCPSQVDLEVGKDFHCIATDSTGTTARITVTIENDAGDITWALD